MDCIEELRIFAKIGAIFAKCDHKYSKEERSIIPTLLEKRFESFKDHEVEIKNLIKDITDNLSEKTTVSVFEKVVVEIEEYVSTLADDDEKQDLIKDLTKFIKKIIKADKKKKKEEKMLLAVWYDQVYPIVGLKVPTNHTVWIICGILVLLILLCIPGMKRYSDNKKNALKAFPLSSYTEKMLQFKEIDFSKVLIYGTETDAPERDSLLLYFAKGTAVLRFRGLDELSVDTNYTTKDTLVLNYNMKNQTALPIDVEINYDESKCRLIDSLEATNIGNSPFGKTLKGITTVAGAAGGMYLGQAIGGLFGIKGQLIGAASGVVLGGVGSYIASANFVKKTKIVQDNSSATIRDMLEDAKPVIAAQLLSEETITQSSDKTEIDIEKISNYYRQQLADILTDIICSDENCKWQKVEIRFDTIG